MTFHPGARRLAVLLVVSLAWAGCKGKEAESAAPVSVPPVSSVPSFKVNAVELGNAIGPDKRVAAQSSTFLPTDTIYAVVTTDGAAPSVTLAAVWTYEDGQVVSESSQVIAPTGPAASEFHIAKPDGFPPGRYKVEIKADNATVGGKTFDVR
ncbi:MAG: hypothetical protein ACREBE_04875 [bacterium]